MTRDVVSVGADTSLAQIAIVLEARGVKRVPVLRAGKLVGIVTRADLVRARAASQPWWRSIASRVSVTDGIVHYWGTANSDAAREAARVAAHNVPGVREVQDHRPTNGELPSML